MTASAILSRAADLYSERPSLDIRGLISLASDQEYAAEVASRARLCGHLGLPVRGFAENGIMLLDWAEDHTHAEMIAALRGAAEERP